MLTTPRIAAQCYRFRWPLSVLTLGLTVAFFQLGMAEIGSFSAAVHALSGDDASEPKPQVFDPRTEVWFDPANPALEAHRHLEDQYEADDLVFVAFREDKDPWGAFSVAALEESARLTAALEKVPYVRNVRSITNNPWIRWGEVEGEAGLVISDLFADAPAAYSSSDRLQRMIAVLGADRAAALAGRAQVEQALGSADAMKDAIGDPRLLRSVVSEDGRTSAIRVQILRPRVSDEKLTEIFGAEASEKRSIAPVIYRSEQQGTAVTAIRKILDADESGYELHFAGVPVQERHFVEVGESDMKFVGLMFVVIALCLLALFRRMSGVLLPLLVVFATIVWMNGTIWAAGDLLNNLTGIAPTIMTAIGISDSVHLLSSYYAQKSSFSDKRSLLISVLEKNLVPVFLTSVTTAIGFFSLLTSHIVPVQQLAYTAGLGTIFAFLLSVTCIPALLSLIPVRAAKSGAEGEAAKDAEHWTAPVLNLVLRHRRGVVMVAAGLGAVVLFGLTRIGFATDPRLMFSGDDPVASDILWVDANLGGVSDFELIFSGAPAGATLSPQQRGRRDALQIRALDPDGPPLTTEEQAELQKLSALEAEAGRGEIAVSAAFLDRLDAYQRRLEEERAKPNSKLAIFSRIDSPLDVLRKMHQVQNRGLSEFYRVPTEADVPAEAKAAQLTRDPVLGDVGLVPGQTARTLIAQYYMQFENGVPPSESLSTFMTPDRRGFRFSVRIDNATSQGFLDAFDRAEDILRQEFPELAGTPEQGARGEALASVRLTGKQFMFANMLTVFSDTMVRSLAIALLTITVMIGFVFRSFWLGVAAFFANLFPILAPLSVYGLLGIDIDGPSVIVASIALGVCVDDTIHIISRFVHGRRAGLSVDDALRRGFRDNGAALTSTTVILVFGFSVLAFGTFRPNAVTGVLGASMIALALLTDFVVLPAMMGLGAKGPSTGRVAARAPQEA